MDVRQFKRKTFLKGNKTEHETETVREVGCTWGFSESRLRGDRFCIAHSIHGTGRFSYIYHENQPNVGIYTIHGSYG